MPGEHVEVVRQAFRLWGLDPDGGLEPIDLARLRQVFEVDTTAAAELFDSEVEIHPPEGAVGGSVQRGYEGIVRNWSDVLATLDEFLIAPLEFRAADGQVIVIQRNIGRMGETEVNETHSVLFSFRNRRIARIDVFASPEGALERPPCPRRRAAGASAASPAAR
jgi:hypothetical protein